MNPSFADSVEVLPTSSSFSEVSRGSDSNDLLSISIHIQHVGNQVPNDANTCDVDMIEPFKVN